MKATEQYFPVVQFIILYKVVLLRLWMKSYGVTILRVTINTPGFDQLQMPGSWAVH